jgi:hypothetical protein
MVETEVKALYPLNPEPGNSDKADPDAPLGD